MIDTKRTLCEPGHATGASTKAAERQPPNRVRFWLIFGSRIDKLNLLSLCLPFHRPLLGTSFESSAACLRRLNTLQPTCMQSQISEGGA